MPRRAASFTQSDVTRDTRLCLDVAAHLAFHDGTVSARTLRSEAARGKLVIFRIGKIFYTTLAEIDHMVEKCPVLPKVPTYISAADPVANQPSSSETEGMRRAHAALQESVNLKRKPAK
jgi:hypothetical protein